MKESQLENKTVIATNDYVRMVDENNNSVKIKKDSFMSAIRDALPSIISDGKTGGGSVLSIIGGALKTRTDANLASVLGVNMVGAKIYVIHNVQNIAFEGHIGWDSNGVIVEVFTKVNKPTYQKFLIGFNASVLGNTISRIQYTQIRDSNPLHFYYSGDGKNARIVISAGEDAIFKITCGSGIRLVENTDTTGMTEKTF